MAISPPGNGIQDPLQGKLMADINVTPMVDVMLVLLIIFMVTAPLLVAGLPVELPKNAAQPIVQSQKPVVVTLSADGSLSIRDERVDAATLIPRLAALRGSQADAVVYVRADKKIPYGDVMELMSRLGASGYSRISLLSHPASQEAGKAAPPAPTGPGTP
ncbi:MAG: ExbD/TolR family protein [Rhodomicrobium sp.]